MIVAYSVFLLVVELHAMATHRRTWSDRSHMVSGLPVWLLCIWLPIHLWREGR